ncbi:uncharacterized protein LOC111705255 isoform X2 [Eurytemora carolleeae]|uniref:uncharacterized protein LOC111705255 isoform X2 n=1 Tax=Eurytemora carolleeae TaxID=1294199 RepID=UPI000C76AB33|nr:uncharacterized protein LOC111705255 isoform X2 [Eurytemora carolleeae]|eukprot:XP_023333523.1 uncharacterized protein LOC111705255 isoform X2 [Eurytemora affinis]
MKNKVDILDSPDINDTRRASLKDAIEIFSEKDEEMPKAGKVDEEGSVGSAGSESATLMSAHAMNLGFYKINLGTEHGQRLHTCHLVVLPLIPVFILLVQNCTNYAGIAFSLQALVDVKEQLNNALEFAKLTQQLQEERASVGLNYFLQNEQNISNLEQLMDFSAAEDRRILEKYTLHNTFNSTDQILQSVQYWPQGQEFQDQYFQTKLKFQIQHSLFRTKIPDGEKSMNSVLDWYNKVNTQTLSVVTYSIQDSDISDFYRYIIGYKNLLRSVEYAGKSMVHGMAYISTGISTQNKFQGFLEYDMLRREYLNQTFNVIPSTREEYYRLIQGNTFPAIQASIAEKTILGKSLDIVVQYFVNFLNYSNDMRTIIKSIVDEIFQFVDYSSTRKGQERIFPLFLIIVLILFIPLCILFTLNITANMTRFSRIYNEKVDIFKAEKKKTEKLLSSLLPKTIIRQMKRGQVPRPVQFQSTTVFFCDIVSFTKIAGESTAHQIIEFLNDLYNLFDERIDNYDVYKVETIGDAYMVASGVPVPNGDQHVSEIAKMSLDLLGKTLTFEIQHKPGYRLKIRIGMHTGSVVGGVVGTKIPHYSIFGDTVELAGLMESSGLPMKIQMSDASAKVLEEIGGFNVISRGIVHLPKVGEQQTYWLIGRKDVAESVLIENTFID